MVAEEADDWAGDEDAATEPDDDASGDERDARDAA